jgi:predicted nuclease of predicted toxin-antitoxin system
MTVLLDHNVPRQLRRMLGSHVILTAKQQGWDLLSNGDLLRAGEAERFEVFLTTDKDFLKYEQSARRVIAIVFLTTNHLPSLSAAHEAIQAAVEASVPGSFLTVDVAMMPRKYRNR